MALNASTNIVENVLNANDSVLIIFFILMGAALIPFYKVLSKERRERAEQENKRQEKYIEQNNLMIKALNEVTSAVAKLGTLIEVTSISSKNSIERIHDRIDRLLIVANRIYSSRAGFDSDFDENIPE